MGIAIGTSGFGYREWKPSFYPKEVPASRFLQHYAACLDAVEIDSSFYRLPTEATLRSWAAATPEGFQFAIKAPQTITHRQRLKLPSKALEVLLQQLPALGSRLAVVLYQLPPVQELDLGRLSAFLEALPPFPRSAFEFRHTSWFVPETYRLLERKAAAFCINDNHELDCPVVLTASHSYVRLRRDAYSDAERDAWCEKLACMERQGIDVLAFIKHKDNPRAPLIAVDWRAAIARGRAAGSARV
jgi:uncharacterized protein YecE (DUF72 family)